MKYISFIIFIISLISVNPPARAESETVGTELTAAEATLTNTETAIANAESEITRKHILVSIGLAAFAVIAMVLLVRLTTHFFLKLSLKTEKRGNEFLKPIVVNKYTLLETNQIVAVALFFLKIIKYITIALLVYLTMTVIFGLFEQTRDFAMKLIGYIISPLKNTITALVKYIPNLFTIIVTITIAQYILKGLRFFTNQIEKGKLVIPGFYPDWSQPTFNILRILLYAFTLILIYPFLPNSDSDIFKGVSVFVGILFSLGSSSVIGNLVAGIVVTYMRPFKTGDRIKIGDTIGFVVEKSATVIRLRTHKNEYITFPNSLVLNSSITNYNISADNPKDKGLILYADITFGYSTPWQTIHEILINAALKTEDILHDPMPFVLQTKLDDFYTHYEINVYTRAAAKIPSVYSELFKNIQNGFREANLDMTAPHFLMGMRPPEAITPSDSRQESSTEQG